MKDVVRSVISTSRKLTRSAVVSKHTIPDLASNSPSATYRTPGIVRPSEDQARPSAPVVLSPGLRDCCLKLLGSVEPSPCTHLRESKILMPRTRASKLCSGAARPLAALIP